jgi:NAD(P)-dependent dehydrogenase (short-subunit alcohol dehydrogenase family)
MEDALFSVAGQVVLVSGASRGIGRAIAEGFAVRGATVIAASRDKVALEDLARAHEEASEETASGQIIPMPCDVADEQQIETLVSEAVSRFGRIDTLLNVAGVNRRKAAASLTSEDFDYVLDINLKGAFLLSLAVGKQMLAQGSGSQINIGSLTTDRPLRGLLPYAVSKAGIGQMTRSLALEWGERGVRVNAIAPGFIMTDLTQKLWSRTDMIEWGLSSTPLRRLGQPDDLLGASIFLASRASAFMTGQIMFVDGGFSCGFHWPFAGEPT